MSSYMSVAAQVSTLASFGAPLAIGAAYLVGGTSPFGLRKAMPVFVEQSVLALPKIHINGGRRGFLVGIEPSVLTDRLGARPVNCAL